MTRKEYALVADVLRRIPVGYLTRRIMAEMFRMQFQAANSRFNAEEFMLVATGKNGTSPETKE